MLNGEVFFTSEKEKNLNKRKQQKKNKENKEQRA